MYKSLKKNNSNSISVAFQNDMYTDPNKPSSHPGPLKKHTVEGQDKKVTDSVHQMTKTHVVPNERVTTARWHIAKTNPI